ncbi:MAG: hypothetical protein ACR2O6_12165 [Ilumatobacteraceae bacterium]
MVTVCWAAKGGSGTTVVAATLALRAPHPSLLVDLDGELPSVLGIAEPDRPGVADWIASAAPAEHLADLTVRLDGTTELLPLRLGRDPESTDDSGNGDDRLTDLIAWLSAWERSNDGTVVIDAGTGPLPSGLHTADRKLLVTRNCYLSVNRAAGFGPSPTGIVLIKEPGRSLGEHEIEHAVGAPIVAKLHWDTDVGRAVDAGLLAGRIPRSVDRELRRAAA